MKRFLQFGVGLILPFFNPCFSQQILKDINATPASLIDTPNNSSQRCFTCGDQVFFLAKDSLGNELWRTDGTLEGTRRVTDLNPGAGDGVYPYEPVLCVNGTAYFRGNFALWKTDGTASGTTRVANNNRARQVCTLSTATSTTLHGIMNCGQRLAI